MIELGRCLPGLPQDTAKIQTASKAQVRRPIYQDSVKLWKRYEKQLGPLWATIDV
jgi:hypothetical protein